METIIKVLFEEINGRAYAFRFVKSLIDQNQTELIRCAVYKAVAESMFVGPDEDDFETLFNLVNDENEVVEDFKDAAIIATVDWNTKVYNLERYEGNYRELYSLAVSVLGKAGDYINLFSEDKPLPNEFELHNES